VGCEVALLSSPRGSPSSPWSLQTSKAGIGVGTADHRSPAPHDGDQHQASDETGAHALTLTWRLIMVTGALLTVVGALGLAWSGIQRIPTQPSGWSARGFRRAQAREAADVIEELRPTMDQANGEAGSNVKTFGRFGGASSARVARGTSQRASVTLTLSIDNVGCCCSCWPASFF